LLLQQRIVGPGVGVFVLLASGELLGAFGHRRILEKPPSGGVSACSESVPLAPALLEQSVALLRRLGWEGAAMVEYKLDRATGTPYLMEVNGRLWGSLQLAIDAGVDFPRLLVENALGNPVTVVRDWRVGVRCRWRLGEVDHLLARVRHSARELSLPEDAPSLGRALGHAVLPAWRPGRRGEVFRWTDPRPGIHEFRNWIRGR
jgi:predicted ATP-grasp superfamily ATP-dependent carboligase